MFFIGIDQSLTGTAIAVLAPSYCDVHLIKSPFKGVVRLEFIAQRIENVLTTVGLDLIDGVAMEGYSMGSQSRQFALGELGGTIKLLLRRLCLPAIIVPPKSCKMLFAENGNASKTEMITAANSFIALAKEKNPRYLAEDITDDNVADAVGLAHVASLRFGTEPNGLGKKLATKVKELELIPIAKSRLAALPGKPPVNPRNRDRRK